ncbi:putative ribosomal protein L29e [Helianthus anomalus]
MAKSKNHTAHNQSYKANRNDIKKPRKHRHTSTKGWRHFGGGSGSCEPLSPMSIIILFFMKTFNMHLLAYVIFQKDSDNKHMAYWFSTTSTLLCF